MNLHFSRKLVNLLFLVVFYNSSSFAQKIAGGYYQTLIICNDSTVMAFGGNSFGQLGNGTVVDSDIPVQISNLDSVIAVSAGDNFSMALKSDGTVWAWGNNNSGQLGIGTNIPSSAPIQVVGLSDVISISCGGSHAIVVKSDGTLWTWGNNNSGQAGNGVFGNVNYLPTLVNGSANFKKVAAGSNHNLALKNDGTVWATGTGTVGALGNGLTGSSSVFIQSNTLPNVLDISSGQNFGVAINSDSTVSTWGEGSFGQLGNGNNTNQLSPVQINSLTEITNISQGSFGFHVIAQDVYGTIWTWGNNGYGQLGDGTLINKNTPVQLTTLQNVVEVSMGNVHSVAIKSDGTLWTWGGNSNGQLGNGSTIDLNSPEQISGVCLVSIPCLTTYSAINVSAPYIYLSPSGIEYISSGIYTDTIQNNAGCDSVITIDLEVDFSGLDKLENVIMSIYPNPTNDILFIHGLEKVEVFNCTILSLSGNVVLRIENTSNAIDVSELKKGVYIFEIAYGNGIKHLRFIKE